MDTRALVRTEDHRVAQDQAEDAMRRLLEEDGVARVTVKDTHGHTLLEVPVRPDEVGRVLGPVAAATKAAAGVVGDVVLRVEREGELPAAPANVTGEDVERIREANAVPEGTEAAVERIEPEQKGEPELKGTGDPPARRLR